MYGVAHPYILHDSIVSLVASYHEVETGCVLADAFGIFGAHDEIYLCGRMIELEWLPSARKYTTIVW